VSFGDVRNGQIIKSRPAPAIPWGVGVSLEPLSGVLAGAGLGAEAPRPAMLDTNGRNVPPIGGTCGNGRINWTRKHFRTRAACRDFLLHCDRRGLPSFFLTLTSSASSDRDCLRSNFQALRKRLARKLDLESGEILYCGVDTSEGHGVLHLLVAVPPGRGRSARFLVSVEWIRAAWEELHGARQFRIVPIRRGPKSARCLARYIVAQYVGGQDALIRLSRSRVAGCSARLRHAFVRLVMTDPRRYSQWVHRCGLAAGDHAAARAAGDGWIMLMREAWWQTFRVGWESLVTSGMASVFGQRVVVNVWGELEVL
jgi:hypothetical protein